VGRKLPIACESAATDSRRISPVSSSEPWDCWLESLDTTNEASHFLQRTFFPTDLSDTSPVALHEGHRIPTFLPVKALVESRLPRSRVESLGLETAIILSTSARRSGLSAALDIAGRPPPILFCDAGRAGEVALLPFSSLSNASTAAFRNCGVALNLFSPVRNTCRAFF